MKELELKIQEILGRTAFENNMEVPEDIKILAKSVRYLASQLKIVCKRHNDEQYLQDVMKSNNTILKSE